MIMKNTFYISRTLRFPLYAIVLLFVVSCMERSEKKVQPTKPDAQIGPNVVYILADDMGYGDIGALNPNAKVHTPALDALIANGMHFTDAHSSSSVCTPSRYSILTGRYAWRSALKRGVTWGYSPPLIQQGSTTVASLMQKNGYRTACIGKWHLGLEWALKDGVAAPWDNPKLHPSKYPANAIDFAKPIANGPTSLGFDYFFGIPASLDMRPYCYIENETVLDLPMRPVDKEILAARDSLVQWHSGMASSHFKHAEVLPTLTDKAVDFIQKNKKRPFFLYFPLTAPHSPLLPSKRFQRSSKAGDYGDFIQMVDHVVHTVSQTLEQEGLAANTLFIFTSDNGTFERAYIDPDYGHDGNHHFRGQKADIYEGGHRVPFIASWKNKISPNSSSDAPILLNDLMATLAELTKTELREGEDSRSILPILQGKKDRVADRDFLIHHSSRGFFAIRKDSLKLIEGLGSGGFTLPYKIDIDDAKKAFQLYNLNTDISEATDLFNTMPEQRQKLYETLINYTEAGRK